jgi:phosphonoacetaldehyde hydrolase
MHPKLKAVVFDWAGTMIDFGCCAPVVALCRVFEGAGVAVREDEVRADMGRAKIDHIRALLANPRVAAVWTAQHGRASKESDVARLFAQIEPMMRDAARDCTTLIPGAAEVAATLRAAGVKIGSCTGYTRDIMADILPCAAEQGYAPDTVVCAGETAQGRPSPLMVWKILVELGVWPATACVKVDDAPVGMAEGRAAGLWTIGVAASGNAMGLSLEDYAALDNDERAQRLAVARASLTEGGAHVVIDTVADLPAAIAALPIG